MNALIKKEIRLLLPAWIAAIVVVAVLPNLFIFQWVFGGTIPYNPDGLPLWFCFGTVFLSIGSFGQEINFRTFPVLLSQPVQRRRIWWTKIIILTVAFVSVLLALLICYKIYFHWHPVYRIPFPWGILTICGLVIFSGGLWTTLLLRQVVGAFWFTLLVPLAILLPVGTLSNRYHWPVAIGVSELIIYSLAGFFWARHLFLKAQDAQWTGGEISFPWRKRISERTAISSQPCHWLSALVKKEFQLHQANILIAALVFGLHLASIVIRKLHPNFENPNVKFILEMVWMLWLLMPMLIGSAAVAEERRLGIVESQLCLPVSRRAQLFIKFSVALVLSLIIGGVMPMLIERAKDIDFHIFYIVATIFFISFYASTLARTTLQAIGITIGICAGLWLWMIGIGSRFIGNVLFHPYPAYVIITIGTLFLALVWLTFGNFKRLYENRKLWRRNLIAIVLSLAFGFTLANAIYFRAWELLTPIEPPHGAARLNDSNAVKFLVRGNCLSAILPDGRLWIDMLAFDQKTNRWMGQFETIAPDRSKSQFIDGSNWTEVAPQWYETLAIKSNGTLWNIQGKGDYSRGWIPFKLTQMGSETNWSHVAGGNYFFLLLKNDGSLWLWGTNRVRGLDKKLAADLATPPARIGDKTNWTGLFSLNTAYARKDDGTFWTWNLEWNGTNAVSDFIQNTNLSDQSVNFVSLNDAYSAEVKTNGELWFFWNRWTHKQYVPGGKIQLGKNVKWKTVGFAAYDSIIAIRSDGTLWKWGPFWNLWHNPDLIKSARLGNHSDWIALSSAPHWYSIALAADGSLWVWGEPSAHAWLAPSRKPVFIGNIFEGQNSP